MSTANHIAATYISVNNKYLKNVRLAFKSL